MTQNQLTELLETEGARSLLEGAEERGFVEPALLEAFALEHELSDLDVEELRRELERLGRSGSWNILMKTELLRRNIST